MDALRAYVRQVMPQLPFNHPLVQKGWHELPADVHALADAVAVPAGAASS